MLMRVKTKNVYEQNGVTYAIIPSAELKVSASASLMMREAKTFWPAEQRPRISISVEFFTCITKALSMYSRHLVNGKVPSLTDFYLYGNRMASIDIYGHRPFDYQTKSLVTEWYMLTSSMTMSLQFYLVVWRHLMWRQTRWWLKIVGGTYLSLTARPSHMYLAREVHFSSLR